MGEAKKRREAMDVGTRITKGFADRGRLIEGGWQAFRALMIPEGAPDELVGELRHAYMAGVEHLWSSTFVILDPEAEITDRDMARMDAIQKEVDMIREEMKLRHTKPQGEA